MLRLLPISAVKKRIIDRKEETHILTAFIRRCRYSSPGILSFFVGVIGMTSRMKGCFFTLVQADAYQQAVGVAGRRKICFSIPA